MVNNKYRVHDVAQDSLLLGLRDLWHLVDPIPWFERGHLPLPSEPRPSWVSGGGH